MIIEFARPLAGCQEWSCRFRPATAVRASTAVRARYTEGKCDAAVPGAEPIKSSSAMACIGPTYHSNVYKISNGLPVPLQTPNANANVGMNSAPNSPQRNYFA